MSESTSETATATAPALVGVWVFDPTDPAGTSRQFAYAGSRAETIEPDATELRFVGREHGVVEYGESTVSRLSLMVLAPFGDDHDTEVAYWRAAVKARRALCYRDNRGRLEWVAMPAGLDIADGRAGTALGLKLLVVDYDETVA